MNAKPGRLTWRDMCRPTENNPNLWRVPAYGFLDSLELTLPEPLPNMDANAYVAVECRLVVNGEVQSFGSVIVRARECVMEQA